MERIRTVIVVILLVLPLSAWSVGPMNPYTNHRGCNNQECVEWVKEVSNNDPALFLVMFLGFMFFLFALYIALYKLYRRLAGKD